MGRNGHDYNYGRAKIIYGCVSINGRSWKRKVHCDYIASVDADGRRLLQVGQLRDFVVVSYTHKNFEAKRGRVRQSTLQGQIMIACLREYFPQPVREDNMWVARKHPSFRPVMQAIPVHDLCSYLHRAPERTTLGRTGYVNLITVAVSFVNA